jgi:hypothetical protein
MKEFATYLFVAVVVAAFVAGFSHRAGGTCDEHTTVAEAKAHP